MLFHLTKKKNVVSLPCSEVVTNPIPKVDEFSSTQVFRCSFHTINADQNDQTQAHYYESIFYVKDEFVDQKYHRLMAYSKLYHINQTAQNGNTLQKGLKIQRPKPKQEEKKPTSVQRLPATKDKNRGLAEQTKRTEVTTQNRFEALGSCDDSYAT